MRFTAGLSLCIFAALAGCGSGGTGKSSGHSVGGTLTGLAPGTTVVLRNNGGDDLSLSASGSFTFATALAASGSTYSVTVHTQPVQQNCTVLNGSGTIAASNILNIAVICGPLGSLALFAGNTGGAGTTDGTGAAARFNSPQGIALDSAGNVYVADSANHVIRKITPAGAVTTFAGIAGTFGSTDGTGAAAQFNWPEGIAADSSDNLYVADTGNHVIRRITPAGEVSTLAGLARAYGNTDGSGSVARFNFPRGIAVDGTGNVIVADTNNHAIRTVTPAGVASTLAGTAGSAGSTDAAGTAARFNYPQGVAIDGAGVIYVADSGNHAIRRITPAGEVTTIAGMAGSLGSADGTGTAARFYYPQGLASDTAGNLVVADSGNHVLRSITAAGVVATLAGFAGSPGGMDGMGAAARFSNPQGIALAGAGILVVADTWNHTIRRITPAGDVTTLAGEAGIFGSTDGTGAAAQFHFPRGIVADSAGGLVVVDSGNNTIRRITPAAAVSTLAGTAGTFGSADGAGAAARFSTPQGVATDTAGNLYIADTGNHTIRRITPAGDVTTLAGTAGTIGSADGTGAAALFNTPQGIAVDSTGNLYVADSGNHVIRRITPTGDVTTLAGAAGTSGSTDGTGSAALFSNPVGIAVDAAGTLHVADTWNHAIRKITAAGEVSTLAGFAKAYGSTDGAGSVARFRFPRGVSIDATGTLYVADTDNHTIRKITPTGTVSTIAGVPGQASFMAGALPGWIALPHGVAVSGNLVYVTMDNGVVVIQLQ